MGREIPGITLRPRTSRRLALYLFLMHLLAFTILIATPFPFAVRLCVFSALLLHATASYRHLTGAGSGEIAEVHLESDGRARLTLRNGRQCEAILRSDSLVTPWLLILRFELRNENRNKNLVLVNDALPVEANRRLRVLLRFVHLP